MKKKIFLFMLCCVIICFNSLFAVTSKELKVEFKKLRSRIKEIKNQREKIPYEIKKLIRKAKKNYKEGNLDEAYSLLKEADSLLEEKENDSNKESKLLSNKNEVLFFDFHYRLACKRPNLFVNHELLDGVIIIVPWSIVEPNPNKYNFAKIDKLINIWKKANKTIVLRIIPYGQKDGNMVTPKWVFQKTPYITFFSKKRGKVKIPKVWNSNFLKIYVSFIKELAKHYNNNPAVKYIEIGIGHIGYLTVQPASESVDAFIKAGWTKKIWEKYVKKLIDIYKQYFYDKKLILTVTPLFLRGYYVKDNIDFTEDIIKYAVNNNYYILFKGISEQEKEFINTGIPQLVKFLASLDVKGLRIGFGDDWPLLGPTGKKIRTKNDFKKALERIYQLWLDIDRKYSFFFVFLPNELAATDKTNKHFDKDIYIFLKNYLKRFRIDNNGLKN